MSLVLIVMLSGNDVLKYPFVRLFVVMNLLCILTKVVTIGIYTLIKWHWIKYTQKLVHTDLGKFK